MADIANILLATDLEKGNSSSILYSIDIAKRFSAKLYILHTYQAISVSEVDFVSIYSLENGLKNEAKDKFNEISKEFFNSDSPSHQFILKSGSIEASIRETISEKRINILVVGSDQHTGIGKLFENETSRLINKLEIPILVVHKKSIFKQFERILFATDLKKLSTQMEIVRQIGDKYLSEIAFVTVEKRLRALTLNESITEIILEGEFKDPEIEHHFIQGDDFEKAILSYSKSYKADLLVMTPHYHSLWEKITQKSVSKNTLFTATVPILLLPQ